VIDEGTDKAIFFAHLAPHPRFEVNDDARAAAARLRCSFPQAGRYTVTFTAQKAGTTALTYLPAMCTLPPGVC